MISTVKSGKIQYIIFIAIIVKTKISSCQILNMALQLLATEATGELIHLRQNVQFYNFISAGSE